MIGQAEDKIGASIPPSTGQPCTIPGTLYENLHQDVVQITTDKARRYLDDWRQKIEAQGSWVAPLSLSASLLMTLLTADFKDRFSVPKEYWFALFSVSFLAAVAWLAGSIKRRIQNSSESSSQIVDRFKNGTS
jgi:hypothetical protein